MTHGQSKLQKGPRYRVGQMGFITHARTHTHTHTHTTATHSHETLTLSSCRYMYIILYFTPPGEQRQYLNSGRLNMKPFN